MSITMNLENDLSMKILGFWRNSRGSLDTHLGKVSATAAKALNDIKPYLKHLNTNKRKEVVFSGAIVQTKPVDPEQAKHDYDETKQSHL